MAHFQNLPPRQRLLKLILSLYYIELGSSMSHRKAQNNHGFNTVAIDYSYKICPMGKSSGQVFTGSAPQSLQGSCILQVYLSAIPQGMALILKVQDLNNN